MMMMMMKKPFLLLELPSEVLCLHVLIRLPLKYLMRLRCVSKFFLDLTSNTDFMTSYLKSNPSNLSDFNFMDTTTTTSTTPGLSNNNQLSWRFDIWFKGSNFIYSKKRHQLIPLRCPSHSHTQQLIDSMNGLVCFGGTYSFEIYNILAGTNYYLLPSSPPRRIPSNPIFAYDPISNDYKILGFREMTVYSFRTNSWTNLNVNIHEFWVYDSVLRNRSVCINGIIYWPPGNREDPYYNGGILSYDLHKETLTEIVPPKQDIQLLSFRGCLAFACIKRTKTKSSKGRKGGGGGGEEGEKARGIKVKLFILKSSNEGGGEGEETHVWINERFVVPISPPKEAEIVSYFDEIFLGWFESKQLRLYHLHTKCFFNLPLSSSDYYPKVSICKKKNVPTYVNNLSFDFSLDFFSDVGCQ